MGMGHLEARQWRTPPGRPGGMGRVEESRAGDRGGTKPRDGSPLTLVELRVLQCELEERGRVLLETEQRLAGSGRWAQRREYREQRHRVEVRKAEVERRLRTMEPAE